MNLVKMDSWTSLS